MRYTIQLCETQASGPPKVLSEEIQPPRPLDAVIAIAKTRLKTSHAPVSPRTANADLVRVVEIDAEGRSTDRVAFETTLAQLG